MIKTMKTPHIPYGKKLPSLLILLFLILSVLSVINVNIIEVSAYDSPAIFIDPASTINETLTPGNNYTIAIKTDYNGNDTWGYQFTLDYNPNVLHGGLNTTDMWTGDNVTDTFTATVIPVVPDSEKVYVDLVLMEKDANYTINYQTGAINFNVAPGAGAEVKATYMGNGIVNGDLISTAKHPTAQFIPGTFNNTAGTLSLTGAFFFYLFTPPFTTSGPGTLANVTFTVVGTGISNITLGDDTELSGSDGVSLDTYTIIDAKINPNQIGHGYFKNTPPIHDVAVTSLVAPATAVLGDTVSINVDVANEGNSTETFNVTVHANTTLIEDQTNITLTRGNRITLTFNWNTTGFTEGNYTIKANATVLTSATNPTGIDEDRGDNTRTAPIELKTVHDVAVTTLEVPANATVGDLVSINVTVTNEGHFEENINLTVSYESTPTAFYTGVVDTANFTLNSGSSKTVSFNWTTTGLGTQWQYIINATATIALDEDPADNTNTTIITLLLGHDVKVIQPITAPSPVFVGQLVPINATVENVGGFTENFTVTAYYGDILIETQAVTNLTSGANITLSFSWNTTDVPPAVYIIKAEAILVGDADLTNNEQTKFVVVKLPPGNIAGTVTDASTGDPIEGANVTTNGYSAITDVNGRYNITDVPAGAYNVTASANGYQNTSQTNITVEAGETTLLDFNLTLLPGTIAGTVTDNSTGNPIAGANVTANGNSATTDANGAYTIDNVSPGNYTVTASASNYVEQSKTVTVTTGTTTTLNFTLIPLNGTISGTVTDSSTGDPISGATVTANGISVSTATNGSYSIELAPGTYDVTVSANGYKGSSRTDITVNAGETTEVNFELTPAQPLNILLYVGVAIATIIIIAGIAVYMLKIRKPT